MKLRDLVIVLLFAVSLSGCADLIRLPIAVAQIAVMEEERRAAAAAAERCKESVYDCPYETKWDANVIISRGLPHVRRASDEDVKDCTYLGDVKDDSPRDQVKKVNRLCGNTIVEVADENGKKLLADGPKRGWVFLPRYAIAGVYQCGTNGRPGTATVQEADGKPTLRIVPDDRTYTAEPTPFGLRTWLAGKWDGSGGGYELTISPNLTWEYTSTVRGRWFAYGTAQIKESGSVVLEGWFSGTPSYGPDERLIMILHRYDESLTGEFRLSQTWRVSFSRAGRPAKK